MQEQYIKARHATVQRPNGPYVTAAFERRQQNEPVPKAPSILAAQATTNLPCI